MNLSCHYIFIECVVNSLKLTGDNTQSTSEEKPAERLCNRLLGVANRKWKFGKL